ncbi:MAG: PD40 domain-containing protein [Kouleothrix sp.]|nr:PD40 domain-containing protein [Kouleothrix sp.]
MIKPGDAIQNRYQVVRLLGSGGFGAVYLAQDRRLNRAVAIKEMDAARLGPDERAVSEQLFEREAQMLASLDHPGLTRVWDYFQEDDRAFLVMEYVPGQTLRDLLRGGPLDEGFVIECALQLCTVLAYLHSRRPPVIFRDIKPANVMVVPEEDEETRRQGDKGTSHSLSPGLPVSQPRFVLIDFGIARLFKPEQPGDTLIIGTPGYAPPEQYGHGQTDQRSDIYSLGATLFQLLSGQVPATVPPPPLASVSPAVSPDLAQLVARATSVDPAARYQSVAELRRDLLAVARARAPQAPGESRVVRPATSPYQQAPNPKATTVLPALTSTPRRPGRSSPAAPIVLALALLAIVALGGLALNAFGGTRGQSGRATPAPQPTVAPASREWLLPGAPGTIAFGQRYPQGGFDVWAATLDGQPPRQITADRQSYSPAWSADGSRMAITRDEGGGSNVYIGAASSPGAEQVNPPGTSARYPSWSPDDGRLAFAIKQDAGSPWRLALLDLATRALTVGDARDVAWLEWSSRGALAYSAAGAGGQQDIFVMDADGQPRNLTDSADLVEDFPGWSPDGRRLAFVSYPAPDQLAERQIYAIDADGGGRTQLTSGPGPHTNPVWSPDGKWIAYLSQEGSPDWQVWAMRADGREPRQITFGAQRKFYLAWGP